MIVYFIVIPVSSELPHWHCVSFIDFCTAVRQRDATRWRVALELSFHCLGWNYWIGWRVENINGKVEEDEEGEYCDIIARVELDCFVLQE